MTYLRHIDGLRGLAVLVVLFAHLKMPYFQGGFVGVDIFFVISGFLITNLLKQEIEKTGKIDFSNFYFRRAKRLLPAFVFTLLFVFIGIVGLYNSYVIDDISKTFMTSTFSLSNIQLYMQSGYFDLSSQINPLLHTWSLSVEEQFYFIFPLVLFLTYKYFHKYIVYFFVVLFLSSLTLNLMSNDTSALYYLLPYRFFELMAGGLLTWVPKSKINNHKFKVILNVLAYIAITYSVITFNEKTIFPSYNALLPVIAAMVLIYTGGSLFKSISLENRPIVFIGKISYSLYLIHWPTIIFLKQFNELYFEKRIFTSTDKITAFTISLIFAYIMCKFIENPFRRISFSGISTVIRKHKRRYIIKSVIVMCACCLAGYSLSVNTLWKWKYNDNYIEGYSHGKQWGGSLYAGSWMPKKADKADIVMLGDSYTAMLFHGMHNHILKKYNKTAFSISGGGAGLYASSALLPTVTQYVHTNQKKYIDESKSAYKVALSHLQNNKNAIFMYSIDYKSHLGSLADIETQTPYNIQLSATTTKKDIKPFLNAFDAMINHIKGNKILLVGAMPHSNNYDVKYCTSTIRWWQQKERCQNMESIDNKNKIQKRLNDLLRAYAKSKNIIFLDPFKAFCDDAGKCVNTVNNMPLFSDNFHLSLDGSNYLMGKFSNTILKNLQ